MSNDPRTTPLDRLTLQRLPKVELHVHLEGSFSPERIARLAQEAAAPLPRPVDQLFEFTNLDDFLSLLDLWCGLVHTTEEAEQIAYDFAARLFDDGLIYAEVMINPIHWGALAPQQLIEAVNAGYERAAAEGLTDCRILVSLARKQSTESAMELVEWMGTARPTRVVGLSLDGNELAAGRTSPRLAAVYQRAGALGFGLTAHAGESSGADGVRDAIELLGVSRIDHGVRSVEDPALVRRMAEQLITCNVCVSSNLLIMHGGIEAHPLRRLVDAGVPVTINTDDPEPLDLSLNDEIELVAGHLGWGIDEVVSSTRQAVDAAFCGPARALELHASIDEFADGLATRGLPQSAG